MNTRQVLAYMASAAMLAGTAACGEHRSSNAAGVAQTRFPGQITAGGGTSGEVMARTAQKQDGSYAGGTPGIAGGSGGNTAGAATGGSVQESGRGPSHGVGATPSSASSQSSSSAATASSTTSTTRP